MKQVSNAIFACSLVALATTAQAALKTRTKSNQCNERSAMCSEEISLLWGSDTPVDVHILSGTATPVTGTEWSFGASNQSSTSSSSGMSAGKVDVRDFSVTKSPGPGRMTISFDGPAGGACPVTYDAVNPIKGVGVVVKKNPGGSTERYSFSDVSVSHCDANSITFSYVKASWNLKENVK